MMGLVHAKGDTDYVAADGEDLLKPAQVAARFRDDVINGTLVRRIEKARFDVDALYWQSSAALSPTGETGNGPLRFSAEASAIPDNTPSNWKIEAQEDGKVIVTVEGDLDVFFSNVREFPVKAAGQLPSGFEMAGLYNSRFQPRGLQMALFGATDALRSLGVEWDQVLERIEPDEVGVYSSSGFGQMDKEGYGGMNQE